MKSGTEVQSAFGMPEYVEIEPSQGCNLSCKMCHVHYKKPEISFLDLDRVKDFSFLKGKTVNLGAAYEPLIHPEINKLIDILNKNHCEICITTNAHFLDFEKIPALRDSNIATITFSFDGISKDVYESIRIGGDFYSALGNIEKFVNSYSSVDLPVTMVNYTVLRKNMHEMVNAVDFWNDRHIDTLNFIAMHTRYDNDFLHENSLWPVKDTYFKKLEEAAQHAFDNQLSILLLSPYYLGEGFKSRWMPYVKECYFSAISDWSREVKNYRAMFEYGAGHGMNFPCKSPFVASRILPNADLMLCSIHKVGNLYEEDFADIWYGEKANLFRKERISSDSLCKDCDYFRLCIDGSMLDLNNIENYYSLHMRKYAHDKAT